MLSANPALTVKGAMHSGKWVAAVGLREVDIVLGPPPEERVSMLMGDLFR